MVGILTLLSRINDILFCLRAASGQFDNGFKQLYALIFMQELNFMPWPVEKSMKELYYANMSVQYTAIFHGCKNVKFQMKNYNIFLIFAQNIDCGYTLEPPQ